MKPNRIFYLSIAVAASLSLTSCLDDEDPAEVRPGFLSFINAMPDTAALDFYVGQDQIDDSSIPYREQYPSSSYLQAAPYTYQVQVAYPDGTQPIFTGNVNVPQDAYISIYIYNDNEEVKGMAIEDNLESPAAGMAKVRFANLGTDAPDADLVPEGETAAWFSDIEFEEASEDYEEVDAGSYMLQIKDSGMDTVLVSGAVQLEDSKVYTIWLSGMAEGTGAKALGLELIEHEEVDTTPAP